MPIPPFDDGVTREHLGDDDACDQETAPFDGDVELVGDRAETLVKLRCVDRWTGVFERFEASDGLAVADGFSQG